MPEKPLTVNWNLGENSSFYYMEAFRQRVLHNLVHAQLRTRSTGATLEEILDPSWNIISSERGRWYHNLTAWIEKESVLVYFSHDLRGKQNTFTVFARSIAATEKYSELISERVPVLTTRGDGTVPFHFWADNEQQGPTLRIRRLTVPEWKDQLQNYPTETRGHLSKIMNLQPPFEGGNLLLWHGNPGVGKSFAIRSLAKEWASWCDTHYIVDPEAFFGRAEYLLDVALSESDTHFEPEDPENPPELMLQADNRYRLLIIEDADEFLRKDAKERKGQSMSRLLNTTDGLIGQGLNLLVLITTNEPLDNIHPAISREGRCLANVEFDKFRDRQTIEEWLGESLPPGYDGEVTLAQMFDLRRERQQIHAEANKKKFGQYL